MNQPRTSLMAQAGMSRPRTGALRRLAGIDPVTLAGLLSGFAMLGAALFLGGTGAAFFSLPAVALVFGGTLAITAAGHSLGEVRRGLREGVRALWEPPVDVPAIAEQVVQEAERLRRDPLFATEAILMKVREPGLSAALMPLLDGIDANTLDEHLKRDAATQAEADARAVAVLNRAAEVAPAMGLIGTLIGLVQMLSRLQDPQAIGPAMAVALLTTLYGAILSTMLFAPLAAKVEALATARIRAAEVRRIAACAIARRENSHRLETMLTALVAPGLAPVSPAGRS